MEKKRDNKNRWRNKTVAFRMSPEEAEQLDTLAKLSGLSKQDYLIQRVLEKEIVVNPNPRVFKALRRQIDSLAEQLSRLSIDSTDNDELVELTRYVMEMVNGLKEDN